MKKFENIFCASNPAKLSEALWQVMAHVGANNYSPLQRSESGKPFDFSDDIIFLPSRRAVRTVEKMIVEKADVGAVLLPRLVALGEAAYDEDDDEEFDTADGHDEPAPRRAIGAATPAAGAGVVSNLERVVVLAKMLAAQSGGGLGGTMPIAKDLVRMMDYLGNEQLTINNEQRTIDFSSLVDERYAVHFQEKAKFLDLAQNALPLVFPGRETETQKRNKDILSWIDYLRKQESPQRPATGDRQERGTGKIIVCGSTASVPATAELMAFVAGLDNGFIILPGAIPLLRRGAAIGGGEGLSVTNPYYSEIKFLECIRAAPTDVRIIDVGESAIDFFNTAFSNDAGNVGVNNYLPLRLTRIEALRESEEMEVVAEIARDAAAIGKSVLIVSPDKAAAQRLSESLHRRGVAFDISLGKPGTQTSLGRFILNSFLKRNKESPQRPATGDKQERGTKKNGINIYSEYEKNNDLFEAVKNAVEMTGDGLSFDPTDDESAAVWDALRNVSDILKKNGIDLSPADLMAALSEALSGVNVRPPMVPAAITILGTIESRMQTADVVLLTGLNEGMFPALGYENPWLPRRVTESIGLPPPERKVSLMALDFMTLSCGPEIYWTRSMRSGGGETTESRFLSRVAVAECRGGTCSAPGFPREQSSRGMGRADNNPPLQDSDYWLSRVRARDDVAPQPMDASAPTPPADWSDVHVTDVEYLIHNPYAFYVRHILRLRHNPDLWEDTTAIDFGNLVHEAVEELTKNKEQRTIDWIIGYLDKKAKEVLEPGSVLFHFWHKRFVEMALVIREFIDEVNADDVVWSAAEAAAVGEMEIGGRTVRARADRVYITQNQTGVAVDIKTGAVPNNSQLNAGMMPQLPIEAVMLQTGKFKGQSTVPARMMMKFVSLARGKCEMISYDGDDLSAKCDAAIAKTKEQFDVFSAGAAPYVYRETNIKKYKEYDDLARIDG